MTCGDETRLAIIEPLVGDHRSSALEHFAGPHEIQAAMPERQRTLRRVEGNVQINCTPNKCQADRPADSLWCFRWTFSSPAIFLGGFLGSSPRTGSQDEVGFK